MRPSNRSRADAAEPVPNSVGDDWCLVKVRMLRERIVVARAIAAVRTVKYEDYDDPWSADAILQEALSEGLIALEKKVLGAPSSGPRAV